MRTVLNGPIPPEVVDLLARRRALGLDSFDEVWDGEYHMNPSPNARHGQVQFQLAVLLDPLLRNAGLIPILEFNLGVESNYRVPDIGGLRTPTSATWVDDAALVVEVLSPDDEALEKFSHFAEFGVAEVMLADPEAESIQLYRRSQAPDEPATGFVETRSSSLLGVTADEVIAQLRWS